MNKYIAEFIGTFALVFFGTGAIIVNSVSEGSITHAGIAAVFGLIVMVMIYALGPVSGAHFNPAVTIAFAVAKRFELRLVPPYLLSQTAGAFAASLCLWIMFPSDTNLGSTIPGGSYGQSFTLELIMTFFLMLVIMQVSSGSKEQGMFAGLAIGATVLLEAMFAGPISGASMNPVRSLSPAVMSGRFQGLWVYLTAPFAGSILAVMVSGLLKTKRANEHA